MNATIVSSWKDAQKAYLALSVKEKGEDAATEYIGSVPLSALEGLDSAAVKDLLVAAAKAVRDAQRAKHPALTVKGTVTI